MANTSGFWKGILWGAVAGGAISLFNRDTRNAVVESFKNTSGTVSYIAKNPREMKEKIKETAAKLQNTIEQMTDDVAYIAGKVEELRESTPQLAEILKETKDAFVKTDNPLNTERVAVKNSEPVIGGSDFASRSTNDEISEVVLKKSSSLENKKAL